MYLVGQSKAIARYDLNFTRNLYYGFAILILTPVRYGLYDSGSRLLQRSCKQGLSAPRYDISCKIQVRIELIRLDPAGLPGII